MIVCANDDYTTFCFGGQEPEPNLKPSKDSYRRTSFFFSDFDVVLCLRFLWLWFFVSFSYDTDFVVHMLPCGKLNL